MALWNQRNLKAPVPMNDMCKSKGIEEEIRTATKTCTNMLKYYATLTAFETAVAFQSRFCIRFKNRLRNMYGFQIMRRLNQILIRIKSIDLVRVIMELHSFFPESNYIERQVNLPVRSNLEYLLVRMQGLAKLLLRVVYLTKEAARYHLKQIARGFLYNMFSMFLGLMGELWLISRAVCRLTVQFYNALYPALDILPKSYKKWLPDGYELPANLADWLGEEYEREILYICDSNDVLELGLSSNIFTLLKHNSKDDVENVLTRMETVAEMNRKDKLQQPSFSTVSKALLLQSLRSDTGERVARTKTTAEQNFDTNLLNHIKSKFHVQQFLTQERTKRTDRPTEAITNGISELKFGDFNIQLMRNFNQLSSADFVKLFKEQFLQLLKSDG